MDICRHHLHGPLYVLVFGKLTTRSSLSDRSFENCSDGLESCSCCALTPDLLSLPQFKFAPLAFVEMGEKSELGGWKVRQMLLSPPKLLPIFWNQAGLI